MVDAGSEERQRGQRRTRLAITASLTSFLTRGLGAALGLAVTPLVFAHLGAARYGLWAALSSLMVWASLVDLGLSRRLQADMAAAEGREQQPAAAAVFATTFWLVVLLTTAVVVLGFVASVLLPWPSLLGASEDIADARVRSALRVSLVVFAFSAPLAVVSAAFAALQRSWQANVLGMCAAAISFGVTIAILRASTDATLDHFIIAAASGGIITGVIGLVLLLRTSASVSLASATWARMRQQLRGSLPFFVTHVATLAINESQILAVAHFRGAEEAAAYAIYARLFGLATFAVNAIDAPLAAGYREAFVRGDHAWLRHAFWRAQALKLLVAATLALAGLVAGDFASNILSRGAVTVPAPVWGLAAFLLVMNAWNSGVLQLFIVFDQLRAMTLSILVNAAFTFTLVLALTSRFGIAGAITGTIAFSLLVATWWMPWLLRKPLREVGMFRRQ